VPHLTGKGFEVLFKGPECFLMREGTVWLKAKKQKGEHSLPQG